MKAVTKEDVLSNPSYFERAVEICCISKQTTIKEISKKLNDSPTNPYFYRLIKFLEEFGFLVVDRSRSPHIIEVKSSDLAWFLREGKQFNLCRKLIKISMGIKPYYYG